jgi:Mrp family chromosome partitioning ATPase
MTTLDQAFIKAFSQQDTVPVAIPPRPAAPAAKRPSLPLGVARSEENLPKDQARAANVRIAREAAPSPQSNTANGVLAALERPPVRPARPNKPASLPPAVSDRHSMAASPLRNKRGTDAPPPREPPSDMKPVEMDPVELNTEPQLITAPQSTATTEQWVVGCQQWAADTEQWAIGSGESAVDTGQWATGVEERSGFKVPGPDSSDCPSRIANRQSKVAETPKTTNWPAKIADTPKTTNWQSKNTDPPETANWQSKAHDPLASEPIEPPEFKPAWQVERFTWPRVCRRLIGRAADELDRLAEALLTANARGQKVLAIAGCRQGEGATTLLLCAARRLAERGIKAVLVDADRTRPRLAKRLGVQPQFGWDEISADEDGSLNQAVVEAASNNLALVPLREPSAEHQPASGGWSNLGACLKTLRDHYELVLVDPGPLEDIALFGDALAPAAGGGIDALLLVHNQRITSENDLAEIEQRLTAAEIAVTGLIENFV